jgi:hypothetical protein
VSSFDPSGSYGVTWCRNTDSVGKDRESKRDCIWCRNVRWLHCRPSIQNSVAIKKLMRKVAVRLKLIAGVGKSTDGCRHIDPILIVYRLLARWAGEATSLANIIESDRQVPNDLFAWIVGKSRCSLKTQLFLCDSVHEGSRWSLISQDACCRCYRKVSAIRVCNVSLCRIVELETPIVAICTTCHCSVGDGETLVTRSCSSSVFDVQ